MSGTLASSFARFGKFLVIVLVLAATAIHAGAESPSQFARWDKAIQAFEKQDRSQPPPRDAVLFVGSSSIRLWDLRKSFPNLPVVNRGFGGSEIADAVHFAPRIVLKYRPRIIVFYAGDNDIAAGKSPERVLSDFKDFVKTVHASLPRTRILFLSIKPSIRRWQRVSTMRQANAVIRDYCKSGKQLSYVDVATPMLGKDGKPRPELFRADGLHLNQAGYRLWATIVRPLLSETQ